MSSNTVHGNGIIAARRRQFIYELALEHGSVSVADLSAKLGVAENTIRNDLTHLHRDGKLVRSYGGAVLREEGIPAPPYSQVKDKHMIEKSWIGKAAAALLPDRSSVFVNAGSTAYQLALNIRDKSQISVTTNSPEIALLLSSNRAISVDLIGGKMSSDSLETDGSLSRDYIDMLYWDIVFYGISAIDLEHGITSINLPVALFESTVVKKGRKIIGLCDSSKFGTFAHAGVGPIGMLDVLVTDDNVKPSTIERLEREGIKVVIAGPDQ